MNGCLSCLISVATSAAASAPRPHPAPALVMPGEARPLSSQADSDARRVEVSRPASEDRPS